MTGLRPSWRPSPSAPRAKSLRHCDLPFRAGDGARRLHPIRGAARSHGARATDSWARKLDVSDSDIADAFKNEADRFGAEVRAGTAVVTVGEAIGLFPIRLACAVPLDLVCDRIVGALAKPEIGAVDSSRYSTALFHLRAALALLAA